MIQPEPYEIIKTVEEPIVTHHVAYTEALPASESIAYASTGLGNQIVSHEEFAGPLEAQYAGLERIPTGGYGYGYDAGYVAGPGVVTTGPAVTTGAYYGAPETILFP